MNRREFVTKITALASLSAINFSSMCQSLLLAQESSKGVTSPLSNDLRNYPHITDVIRYEKVSPYFHIIVNACSDRYIAEIPFIIELEVCKIWKESLFEWDAISVAGAAGLQQLMESTAKFDLGLSITPSPELNSLNDAISEYRSIQGNVSKIRQELYKEVESGVGDLTQSAISKLNKLRSELRRLTAKRDQAYKDVQSAKKAYAEKIRSMTMDELKNFDARFVPEIAIPAGVKYMVKIINECKSYFGGPVEMNIWRALAAYNAGLKSTKDSNGFPFINQTVLYTRDILVNLTRMLELKSAYLTGDPELIARTKQRFALR